MFTWLKKLFNYNSEVDKAVEAVQPMPTDNAALNETVAVATRARKNDGKFVGDNPATPDVNEAWVGGKAPTKKKAPAKMKAPGKAKKTAPAKKKAPAKKSS